MKRFVIGLLAMLLVHNSFAQARYLIRFKNKSFSPYTLTAPAAYLSPRAIDRRTRYHISIDSTDLPVTPAYLDSIKTVPNVVILNVSKWLNQVSIQTDDAAALAKINTFSFVISAAPIANTITSSNNNNVEKTVITTAQSSPLKVQNILTDYYSYGSAYNQIHIHNGEFLHNIGLQGQQMIIGMLDAGFYQYTSLKAFDSINAHGQVLGTWDFVNREASVVEDHYHGMECLSTIAANIPGTFVGTAPQANFYLFKTEDITSEYPIEELNWVCGAERIDSAGGDIISSSLGYNQFDNAAFNHTYADLNGNTTIAAMGAELAAKKGILVLVAAGNSGTDSWHYIDTPADADSVLAVGAVNASGQPGSFSSYGPSADGRIKPDIASLGVNTTVQKVGNTIGTETGTSLSCPNMAGLATCLWQGFQEFNNIKIISALKQAGSIASAPDNRIGYGIPDVKKAVMNLIKEFATSSVAINNCMATISWTSKDVAKMKYEIERKTADQTSFVKIADKWGAGNTFATHTYQFTDTLVNVPAGTIAYRVHQVIDTAASGFMADYIDTASIMLDASCVVPAVDPVTENAATITLLPNPATTFFTINMASAAPVSDLKIRIINNIGQTVLMMQQSKPAHAHMIRVPIANLASGKYYVSIYDGSKLITTRQLLKL